jgi:hypothetical protein
MNTRSASRAGLLAAATMSSAAWAQDVVYSHAMSPTGNIQKSSWWYPEGRDDDHHTWDAFTLAAPATISEVRWLGGYTNFLQGAGQAPVYAFELSIWPSIAAGSQPNVVGQPLAEWLVESNAGESPTGTTVQTSWPYPVAQTPVYSYRFVLPEPFQAAAGTKYWLQIVARQGLTPQYYWPPDWGLPGAAGGDNSHFRAIGGSGHTYQSMSRDLSFTLLGSPSACYPNCDGSTQTPILNVADFTCFLQRFAAGESYANCDQSTTVPVLNVADFTCFLQRFAAGCP